MPEVIFDYCPFINQPCNAGVFFGVKQTQSRLQTQPLTEQVQMHCVFFDNKHGCRLMANLPRKEVKENE